MLEVYLDLWLDCPVNRVMHGLILKLTVSMCGCDVPIMGIMLNLLIVSPRRRLLKVDI